MWVRRNGVVNFIQREGRTSASKIAPVEIGLQSLVLFPVGTIGIGSVLCHIKIVLFIICISLAAAVKKIFTFPWKSLLNISWAAESMIIYA